jgi:hypothetical protein
MKLQPDLFCNVYKCPHFGPGRHFQHRALIGQNRILLLVPDVVNRNPDMPARGNGGTEARVRSSGIHSLNARSTALGSRSMTVSRTRAARSGVRQPCSQS